MGLALLVFRACQLPNPLQPDAADTPDSEVTESGLTLRDVTLEQPDENGQLLWRVKGDEVTYSPDRQVAYVTSPDGELFQDGKVIYRVQADTGEVRENGQVIFLRGNIVATGVENQSVLRGNELEWRPEEDRLIVSEGITGNHPQIQAEARRAEVFNREKRMVLEGDVMATAVAVDGETESPIKLQAERLVWFWEAERLETSQPLRAEQLEAGKVTDFITGDRGQLDLAAMVLNLQQNVEMRLLEFPLRVTSEAALWQVEEQQVQINQPLRLLQPEEEVVVTAQSGRMDLENEQVYLIGSVSAQGQNNQTELTSDRLRWDLPQETVVAEGNVTYQQGNPQLRLQGSRAVGRLDNQTVVVDGGPVVTEIVPN
ncbi:LPS export ABC transporter periplasmic protein LptC [filamentous cyanobacterium CCP5]|nr:LPS export ABC transporter periplasmic protein LptC [filamentous cyanobacterium CCP5]